jgi:hypothetical protein
MSAARICSSMYDGSLRENWKALVTFQQLIILADGECRIDMTAQAIAARTGIPLDLIIEGIAALEQTDPQSRTPDLEGRRITRLDPRRPWGWRVVNFRKYQNEISKPEEIAAPGEFALQPTEPCPAKKSSDTNINHEEVIKAYHELLPEAPQVKVWSKKRRQALDARIRERCKDGKPAATIDYWRGFFEKVAASDFLCGRATSFVASLEWLLRPENFLKVIEGNYANRSNGARGRG